MGCNCKSTNKNDKSIKKIEEKGFNGQHWLIKLLLFVFTIVLLPLIMVLFLWIMYNSVINGKPVNDSINFLNKRIETLKFIKNNELNEDNDDDEEIDEEKYDYELIGLDKK